MLSVNGCIILRKTEIESYKNFGVGAEMSEALGGFGCEGPAVMESFTVSMRRMAYAAAIWRPDPARDEFAIL